MTLSLVFGLTLNLRVSLFNDYWLRNQEIYAYAIRLSSTSRLVSDKKFAAVGTETQGERKTQREREDEREKSGYKKSIVRYEE